MNTRRVFFIDSDGKIISDDEIGYHEELAKKVLENNENLNSKYLKSGLNNKTLFLIVMEKYFAGSNTDRYREISYLSPIVEERKGLLAYYYEEGYKLRDLRREYGEKIDKMIEKISNQKEKEI